MSQNEIHTEIKALLDWNPSSLSPHLVNTPESNTQSRSSRAPSIFYDKHIRADLILKEVWPLPLLHHDIAAAVDQALGFITNEGITLPRLDGADFRTASQRAVHDRRLARDPMINEQSVVDFYRRTTASYCITIASILGFHPRVWNQMIDWSVVPSQSHGPITNGFLRVERYISDILLKEILPHSDDEKLLDEIKERGLEQPLTEVARRFTDLATWEFMSMNVESDAVMNAFGVRNPFQWVSCHDVSCPGPKIKVHPYMRPPDATATAWRIPMDPAGVLGSGSTRIRELEDTQFSDRGYSPTGCNSKTIVELQDCGDLLDRDDGDEEGGVANHKSDEELTADKLLRQAWARAALNDSTLLCFNSGSNEYIGVRHRETQRLYLSDCIKPSECERPRYGKLHVGLYIAVLRDAMDRAQQLSQREKVDQGLDQRFGPVTNPSNSSGGGAKENFRDQHDRRGMGGSGVGLGGKFDPSKSQGAGKKRKRVCGKDQEIFAMASVRNRNLALLYLNYGIYDSPAPALFIRKETSQSSRLLKLCPGPSPLALDGKYHFRPEEYISLILTSEMAEGATGKAHRAKLEVLRSDDQIFTADVVVKIATMDEHKERLENEYVIYKHLASKEVGGIIDVLGIFDDVEGEGTFLVMTYGGSPLERGQSLSSMERAAFLHTLEKIHAAGVLHFDLRTQNLLINELGETVIIDFDQSVRGALKRAMKREYAQLVNILDSLEKK